VAPGAARHGLGRQEPARDLRADEGSARNGGRTLAQIVDHNAHDRLVAWDGIPATAAIRRQGRKSSSGN